MHLVYDVWRRPDRRIMRNRYSRPLGFSCGLDEKIITLVGFFFWGGGVLNVFQFSKHSSTFFGFSIV